VSALPKDAPDPKEAAKEILAGQPAANARAWLGPLTLVMAVLFAIDTYVVAMPKLLPFDLPVAIFVQSFPWGPLVYAFDLLNAVGGWVQVLVGAAAVVLVFVWERRAGWLMTLGAISSLLDNLIKIATARHRPTADLVHILTPAPGYSYPSGHAVFFTWMSFMLALAVAPRMRPRYRWVPWTAAAVVIVIACVARIWAGAHWPSDVLGGFLLGLGWSAFVMWLPERWLPAPDFTWWRGRRQPS
jgi:membrane-associated phospholipid phosphatase